MLEIIRFKDGVVTVAETTYRKYYLDFDEGTITPLRFENGDFVVFEDPDEE